jgi:hypothetical protein
VDLINPEFMAFTGIKLYSTIGLPTLSYGREHWAIGKNDSSEMQLLALNVCH